MTDKHNNTLHPDPPVLLPIERVYRSVLGCLQLAMRGRNVIMVVNTPEDQRTAMSLAAAVLLPMRRAEVDLKNCTLTAPGGFTVETKIKPQGEIGRAWLETLERRDDSYAVIWDD